MRLCGEGLRNHGHSVFFDYPKHRQGDTYDLGSDIQSSPVVETKNVGSIQRCPKANGYPGNKHVSVWVCLSCRNSGTAQGPMCDLGTRAGLHSLQPGQTRPCHRDLGF